MRVILGETPSTVVMFARHSAIQSDYMRVLHCKTIWWIDRLFPSAFTTINNRIHFHLMRPPSFLRFAMLRVKYIFSFLYFFAIRFIGRPYRRRSVDVNWPTERLELFFVFHWIRSMNWNASFLFIHEKRQYILSFNGVYPLWTAEFARKQQK